MLTQHIALVPEVAGVNPSELARVSAALQKQMTRDLFPIWNVSATVDAFPHLEDVPVGYWPVILAFGELGTDEGVHVDKRGQPYAIIEMSPSWSLTASHVCIEMLIDPYGNRTVVGPSPRSDQGSVEFLLEVCDPCEDARYAYTVNDVLVSDFCTPEFLAQMPAGKERYSFTGAVEAPYQVLPGGRLSWYDPASNRWWQRNHFGGAARDTDLGFIERRVGRGFSVNHPRAPKHLQGTKMTLEAFESRMGISRQRALHASQSQAHLLRVHLGNPGGLGSLAIDATAPTVSGNGARLAGVADRPQVLSALMKASVGATSADPAAMRRRALAEALASDEDRAIAGGGAVANVVPPPAQPPPLPVTSPVTVNGLGPTPDFASTSVSATNVSPRPVETSDAPRARHVPQEVRGPDPRQQPQRRSGPAPFVAGPRSAQRPHDARRTIPPPMPRSATPAPVVPRSTASRVGPSIAPTAMNVPESQAASRPPSSTRDRVVLVGAVAALCLLGVGVYSASSGSSHAPTSAAASIPAPQAAPPPPPTAATAAPAASEHPAEPAASAAATPKPVAEAPAATGAPHAPAARVTAPKGPRPKVSKAGDTKAASTNPYDDPPAAAAGDSLDRLVDDRR